MLDSEPPKRLVLPENIQSKQQVIKLISEILRIEEFLSRAKNRQAGTKLELPKTTSILDKFAEANQRNVLNHNQRTEMAHFLREVYKRAPEVSLVLQLGADKAILNAIIKWFRENIHAQTLVKVSFLSSLAGGAIVRIKHRTYDLSLAKQFGNFQDILKAEFAENNSSQLVVNSGENLVRNKFF